MVSTREDQSTSNGRKIMARPWWVRILELAAGVSAMSLTNFAFDYLLYPAVIYWLGLVIGGLAMAGLSFLACWLMLWFYDRSGRDWLGIEAAKQVREYIGHSRWRKWLAQVLRKGDFIVCIVLSIKFDQFVTTAYMRHGAFNGMSRRDWRNFWTSWFIGNAWWSLFCFAGVTSLAGLWRWLITS